ncbi:MAG: hypothetical protein ABR577_09050 [Pyrinomonadaceae bacterium]
MNFSLFSTRLRYLVFALAIAGAAIAGISLRRTVATSNPSYTDLRQQFYANVHDGVGSEVQFAKSGDDARNIRASIESVSQFMRKRSGTDLNGRTKTRLADMEAGTLVGTNRRITAAELSEILAATALERLSAASDEEINHAAVTLQGFDAPDLSRRRGTAARVSLRASRGGIDPLPEEFAAQVKAVRDSDPIIKNTIIKSAATRIAANEVQGRMKCLSAAVPEQFSVAATSGFTPLQAVLIAYSIASDDPMDYSATNLQKRMQFTHDVVERHTGQPYPAPDGHFAYGPNGYIYSSPLDFIFDDRTINVLLNHIAERSANQ